ANRAGRDPTRPRHSSSRRPFAGRWARRRRRRRPSPGPAAPRSPRRRQSSCPPRPAPAWPPWWRTRDNSAITPPRGPTCQAPSRPRTGVIPALSGLSYRPPVNQPPTPFQTVPAPARPYVLGALASLSAAAAAIHFAVVFEHFRDYTLYGVFFLVL